MGLSLSILHPSPHGGKVGRNKIPLQVSYERHLTNRLLNVFSFPYDHSRSWPLREMGGRTLGSCHNSLVNGLGVDLKESYLSFHKLPAFFACWCLTQCCKWTVAHLHGLRQIWCKGPQNRFNLCYIQLLDHKKVWTNKYSQTYSTQLKMLFDRLSWLHPFKTPSYQGVEGSTCPNQAAGTPMDKYFYPRPDLSFNTSIIFGR